MKAFLFSARNVYIFPFGNIATFLLLFFSKKKRKRKLKRNHSTSKKSVGRTTE